MTATTLLTLVLLWASAAWTLAAAISGVPAPFAIGVAIAGLIQAELVRRLELPKARWTTGAEIASLSLVVVVTYLVIGSNHERLLLVGMALALVSWLLAQITVTDLDSIRQPVDLVEGMSSPIDRLRGRVLWVGVALSLAVASMPDGLIPPSASRDTSNGFLFPYLVYWMVGLTGISLVNRQRHLARWSREGATVDQDLGTRWVGGTATWILTGVVATALLLVLANPVVRVLHGASSWIVAGVVTLTGGEIDSSQSSVTVGSTRPATTGQPDPAEPDAEPSRGPLSDFLLIVALGAIFASVYLLVGRHRRTPRAEPGPSIWRGLARMFLELARGLWRLLAGLLGARRGWRQQQGPSGLRTGSGGRERWSPTDPVRRHIASEFRAYLKAARQHDLAPMHSETVLEFGRRAGRGTSMAAVELTDLYSRARYSTHLLGEADNNAARSARAQAVADLEEGDGGVVSSGI